ncbi:putative glutathione s-transferase protein [Eutypa lata UCREL1]|uniref:Putative glutathione s-transferase protein n=1 Tax=Eutypa lata (strain UCR-EL1) TaxID=1287681 RepID=M7TLN3_EUTLA|nr:putative glutathione s-transferase protein [Eutypa lata UCREL1]
MPLELSHLHLSQSERIVWLLEEMQIPYELKVFYRDPITALGPPELKSLSPAGTAPYLRDTNVSPPICLSESTAIATYLLAVYGPQQAAGTTRMDRSPSDPDYAAYLEWLHFANGTLQASMFRQMSVALAATTTPDPSNDDPNAHPAVQRGRARLENELRNVDAQLGRTGAWLAGPRVSAADCMAVFSLTTMRGFMPLDLAPYPNVLRWLGDVAARPAYRRALEKGDGAMEPMVGAKVRRFTEFKGLSGVLGKL